MSEPGGRQLVLFDGVCALCNRSVRLLLRIDRHQRLLFAPLQGTTGRAVAARHGLPEDPRFFVLVRDFEGDAERVEIRSDAALGALAIAGGGWRVLTVLRVLPRPIRDRLYEWVAAHRYRWFGRLDAMPPPPPDAERRFLD